MADRKVEVEIISTADPTGFEEMREEIKKTEVATSEQSDKSIDGAKKSTKAIQESIEPIKVLDIQWKKSTAGIKDGTDKFTEGAERWRGAIGKAAEAFPPLRLALLFINPITAAVSLAAIAFLHVKQRLEEFQNAIHVGKFQSLNAVLLEEAEAIRQSWHESEAFERSLGGVVDQSAKLASINDRVIAQLEQKATLEGRIDDAEKARLIAGVARLERTGLDPKQAALLRDRIEEQFAQRSIARASQLREDTIDQRKLEITQQGQLFEQIRAQLTDHETKMAAIESPQKLAGTLAVIKSRIDQYTEEIKKVDELLEKRGILSPERGALEASRAGKIAAKEQAVGQAASLEARRFAMEEESRIAKERQLELQRQIQSAQARRTTLQTGLEGFLQTSGAEIDTQRQIFDINRRTRELGSPEAQAVSQFGGTRGRVGEFSGTRDTGADQVLQQATDENKRLTEAMLSFGQATLETQQVTISKLLQLENQIKNSRPTQ